jgi:hypothetical protein
MKRFFAVLAVTAFVVGVPLSHLAVAVPPEDKVDICHIPDSLDGHVISVAESAVEAHLAHGDCLAVDAVVAEDGSCVCTTP